MPLLGKGHFKENVRTLMGEIGQSPHVQSRAQALAIAYSKERGRAEGGSTSTPKVTILPPQTYEDYQRKMDAPYLSPSYIRGYPSGTANLYGKMRPRYQDGGEVDIDPWEASAARVRARAPVREPDPAALAASQGAVGWGDLARAKIENTLAMPGEARREAWNVATG